MNKNIEVFDLGNFFFNKVELPTLLDPLDGELTKEEYFGEENICSFTSPRFE